MLTVSTAARAFRQPVAGVAAGALLASVMLAGCNKGGSAKPAEPATTAESSTSGPTRLTEALTHIATAEDAVRANDKEKALIEFQRAIEINPNLTTAYMGMADIYRMDRDYEKAELRYAQAARVEPKNFDAQFYHGLMLHLLERVTEAIQSYLRALTIRPDDFQANLNLATAYYQIEENTQALPYARKAVALDKDDGSARLNLGAIYAALGRHQDAVNEYQQAAELMPLTGELLLNLAESLANLSRFDEMANALEQAAKTHPSAAVFERLGFARFRLKDYAAASTNFQKSLDIDADYFPALNGLGVSTLNDWIGGDRQDGSLKERGVAMLRRSLQLEPDQPQIREIVTRYGR